MALIIVKQSGMGIYFTPPEISENEIFETLYFDTETKITVSGSLTGGSNYEMDEGQLIYTNDENGDQYFYSSFFPYYEQVEASITPPSAPRYSLSLFAYPIGNGAAANLTSGSPYLEGAEVELLATPSAGSSFVKWMLNGQTVSLSPAFTFTMPAANSLLVASFLLDPIEESETPAPEPGPDVESANLNFYPLEIRVRGVQIPIPSITEKKNTGLFSEDFEGEYSYPVTIQISEAVRLALNLPDDPQSSWDFSNKIPAELWAGGNRRYTGFLDILSADEKSIRTTFILNSGFFIEANKTRKVAECYHPEDTITINRPIIALGGHELRFNFRDLKLTVNGTNKLFLKAQHENHIEMLEEISDYLESLPLNLDVRIQYSDDLTDESSRIIAWDTTIPSTIKLEFISMTVVGVPTLNSPTASSRFTGAKRLTNTRFDMGIYNNSDEENRIAFPEFHNRNLYDQNNPIHDGIVNRYDRQGNLHFGNISYLAYSEAFRWENAIIPFIYLTDIVKNIFKFLKIDVTGDFFDNPIVKKLLVYNNRTLDFVQVSQNGIGSRRTAIAIHAGDANPVQTAFRYQNVHDFNIKLQNHVPDMSITDFLKFMKNYFNLKYDFNVIQNRVEIKFIADIYRNRTVFDLTGMASRVYSLDFEKEKGISFSYLNPDPIMQDGNSGEIPTPDFTVSNYLALPGLDAEIDQIAKVRSLKAYFRLTPNQDESPSWKLFAFDQQDDTAENTKKWTVGMVPLVDGFYGDRKIPAIEMTANQPEINLFNKETGLRITAFYGQKTDGIGGKYAYASSTRSNAKELADINLFDLDVRGPDIYPLWQYSEKTLEAGKIYQTTLVLTEESINNLSKTSRVRIANIDYLISAYEITSTFREMAIAKVWMYKIKI